MIKEKRLESYKSEIPLSGLENNLDGLSVYLGQYFNTHSSPKLADRYNYLTNFFSNRNSEGKSMLSMLSIPQYNNTPIYKENIMLYLATQPALDGIFTEEEISQIVNIMDSLINLKEKYPNNRSLDEALNTEKNHTLTFYQQILFTILFLGSDAVLKQDTIHKGGGGGVDPTGNYLINPDGRIVKFGKKHLDGHAYGKGFAFPHIHAGFLREGDIVNLHIKIL
jgi:hypothetical protein